MPPSGQEAPAMIAAERCAIRRKTVQAPLFEQTHQEPDTRSPPTPPTGNRQPLKTCPAQRSHAGDNVQRLFAATPTMIGYNINRSARRGNPRQSPARWCRTGNAGRSNARAISPSGIADRQPLSGWGTEPFRTVSRRAVTNRNAAMPGSEKGLKDVRAKPCQSSRNCPQAN